ncbi:MAG: oligopeptidase B, partial [Schleiferiaceae bacterium]|nr:oligopeptidase B [Schleiferiaceae bacterium]
MKQPLAKQTPHVHSKHGDERHDPYQWMTDRTSDDVLSHLNAENAYRKALMEPVTALEAELAKEMTDRLVPDDATVPVRIGDYWYQTRFESGNEYPQFYRRSGDENGPE